MSEKRFVLCKKGDVEYIEDNCCVQLYGFDVLCEMLNEQQATINELKERNAHNFAQNIQLKKEIKELKEEEKLYAKEIVRLNKNIEELNKTIEEALKFKSLGGDY